MMGWACSVLVSSSRVMRLTSRVNSGAGMSARTSLSVHVAAVWPAVMDKRASLSRSAPGGVGVCLNHGRP
ncbi:MAG: hypothetical protein JWQ95_5291 [Sphaerisporangium sp.]|nr:hypothetical protein [Sphaerisporangium sp.]